MSARSDKKLVVDSAGDCEIVMTRAVAAPRALVFDAWTKPEHVRRWLLGPDGWTMPVCNIDLRVDGAWRYVLVSEGGRRLGMRGVYREIAAPERLVFTESMDDGADDPKDLFPGGPAINTLSLVERDGITVMTLVGRYSSRAIRDAALASGMEKGVARSFERLDEIVGGGAS